MDNLYARFLQITDILTLSEKYEANNYEFKNAIESYLLSEANSTSGLAQLQARLDPVLFESVKFLLEIIYLVTDFGHKLIVSENSISYGIFEFVLSPQRLQLLLRYNRPRVGEMLLRYGTIITTSQHWCVPTLCYIKLVRELGIEYEGFASPVNSQLLKLSQDFEYWTGKEYKSHPAIIKHPKYCSVFVEDSAFGSIGSFFDQDWGGRRYTAMTPYIPELMPVICDKILHSLKTPHTVCVVGLPAWRDTEWFKRMSSVAVEQMEYKKNYWFEENDKPLQVPFTSVWMVLANVTVPPVLATMFAF